MKYHRYMHETAILHLHHMKLLDIQNLTVLYLTATNDHTQDGPTRTYAVALAFAHTSMRVCTHMYVHSRSHTLIVCTTAHMYTHAYKHTHVRIQIYAHAHATTYTSEYIRTVCRRLPHTFSCSHMHTCSLMQARTFTTHTHAHTVVHSHSWTLPRARTLVRAHTLAHAHTFARTRKHLKPPYIHKHKSRPVGIHW